MKYTAIAVMLVLLAAGSVLNAQTTEATPQLFNSSASDKSVWTRTSAQGAPLLDINSAEASQLADQLPGIGPAKAGLIVEFRKRNGAFTSIEQLQQVKGIGPKTVEKLRPLVRLGSDAAAIDSQIKQRQSEKESRAAFRRVINSAKLAAQPESKNKLAEKPWYQRSVLEIMRTH